MKDIIIHFFTLPIEKRTRIVVYFFQTLFTTVFAYFLFRHFTNSSFTSIENYNSIIKFILTGEFLLYLFFFFAAWIVFYEIGYYFMIWSNKKVVIYILDFIWKWIKRKGEENQENIENSMLIGTEKILAKIGAIEFAGESIKVKRKGKYYAKLNSISKHLKNQFSDKRFLMPYLVLVMIFQFCIIYFNILDNVINSWFLDSLVVSAFLFYLVSFFLSIFILEALVRMISLMEKALDDVN